MGKDKHNANKDELNRMEADELNNSQSEAPKTISEPRQCQTCESTGLNPEDNSQLCPTCGGSGTVE